MTGKLTEVDKIAIRDSFLSGDSSESIAPFFGISPQYVRQLIKENDWRELRDKQVIEAAKVVKKSVSLPQIPSSKLTAQDLVLLEAKNSDNFRKDNPIVRNAVLIELSKGVSLTAAARKVGVNHKTLKAWREKDPEFDVRCHESQADFISKMEAMACGVETPREALTLLSKHPLTKKEWNPESEKGGIKIEFSFSREDAADKVIDADFTEVKQIEG